MDFLKTNWIPILSAFVIIVGWFINNYFNRKLEISKERLKYRLDALNSCIELLYELENNNNPLSDSTFKERLLIVKRKLFFYGNSNEYISFLALENYIYESEILANKEIEKLKEMIRKDISKYLKLK